MGNHKTNNSSRMECKGDNVEALKQAIFLIIVPEWNVKEKSKLRMRQRRV